MRPDTLILVNPAAGQGRARQQQAAVADYLAAQGQRIEFSETQDSEDVRQQAQDAAAGGVRLVVALGGDGTVHHLIEGLLGTPAAAGILPTGSGNDIARSLGIPLDPIRAADTLLRAHPHPIDIVRARFANAHTAHFIAAGGMGLDAEAADRANTIFRRWPGVTRYLAGAFTAFADGATFELRATLDGRSWSGRALLAVVANGPYYGSGVHIAPAARMDDGYFDVLLVRDVSWARLVEAIPILLSSGDLRFQEIERCRCRSLRLETDRPVKVHGDGEFLGESPAQFEIVPEAVCVMVPRLSDGAIDRERLG